MYSNALLLRRPNDKPKEYDSLLEYKKDDTTNQIYSVGFESSSEKSSEESVSGDNIESPSIIEA